MGVCGCIDRSYGPPGFPSGFETDPLPPLTLEDMLTKARSEGMVLERARFNSELTQVIQSLRELEDCPSPEAILDTFERLLPVGPTP